MRVMCDHIFQRQHNKMTNDLSPFVNITLTGII